MLRCDVITLFPEMVTPVLDSSMLKRAREKGSAGSQCTQPARLYDGQAQGCG